MKNLISEFALQSAFVQWAELMSNRHPALSMLFSIPNGANKSPAARMKFKREGLRSGVPDLCLPFPAQGFHGLYLEFKSRRGTVSIEQKDFMEKLKGAGYQVEVVRSTEAAIEIVKEYLQI